MVLFLCWWIMVSILKSFCFNFVGIWTVLASNNQRNYVFQNLMDFSTVQNVVILYSCKQFAKCTHTHELPQTQINGFVQHRHNSAIDFESLPSLSINVWLRVFPSHSRFSFPCVDVLKFEIESSNDGGRRFSTSMKIFT